MDDALQLEPIQIKVHKKLVLAVAASLVLHAVCAYFLLFYLSGPPPRTASITYIDLNAIQHAVPDPMAVPAPQAPQAEIPVASAPEIPETPPQVQQPQPAQLQPPQAQPAQAQPAQPATTAQTAKAEDNLPHSTIGLGLTKGYFKSLGEGETLRADIKAYYLEMLQGINEKWWMDQQLDKRRLSPVVVNITIARNGEIIVSEILRSSGSARFDKAVLAALSTASPLPPLPASYTQDTFQAPVRLVPPLNLMAW